jgi:hypothetical protein
MMTDATTEVMVRRDMTDLLSGDQMREAEYNTLGHRWMPSRHYAAAHRELNDQNCSFMNIYRNGILPSDLDDISH